MVPVGGTRGLRFRGSSGTLSRVQVRSPPLSFDLLAGARPVVDPVFEFRSFLPGQTDMGPLFRRHGSSPRVDLFCRLRSL